MDTNRRDVFVEVSAARQAGDAARLREIACDRSVESIHRLRALRLLSRSGGLDAGSLRPLLADDSRDIRIAALRLAGKSTDPAYGDHIASLLTDPDGAVAAWAARVLGETGAVPQAGALIDATQHVNPQVRLAAAWALGELRDPRATDALAALLAREHGLRRRRVIRRALRRIRPL